MDSLDTIEDFDETIFGKTNTSAELLNSFKPWHKPRKQWIRVYQWGGQITTLLEEKDFAEKDVIHYFGLPGEDCLDLQTIGRILPAGKKLFFYGIESKEDLPRQTIMESKLKDMAFISEQSKILNKTRFEDLAQENSTLTNNILIGHPFHIVNLDLTDSLLGLPDDSRLLSFLRLLNNQFDKQHSKWLLFLTTRCDKDSINIPFLEKFLKVFQENYQKDNFRKRMNKEFYGCSEDDIVSEDSFLKDDVFEKIAIISIMKVILKNAIEKDVFMKAESVITYSVYKADANPDMVSVVLSFKKKNTVRDAAKIIQKQGKEIDEEKIAIRVIDCVAQSKNADKILSENNDVKEMVTSDIKQLLHNSGYDVNQYPF